jgi:hypothetical protein
MQSSQPKERGSSRNKSGRSRKARLGDQNDQYDSGPNRRPYHGRAVMIHELARCQATRRHTNGQEQRREQSRVDSGSRTQLFPLPDYHSQARQERQWVPAGSQSRQYSQRPQQDWRPARSVSRPQSYRPQRDWNEQRGGETGRRRHDDDQRQRQPSRGSRVRSVEAPLRRAVSPMETMPETSTRHGPPGRTRSLRVHYLGYACRRGVCAG